MNFLAISKTDESLVWYAGYGSNVLADRFLCYIIGGRPTGSQKTYEGCRDKTPPKQQKPTIIKHELYFAKKSKAWENGGVGFVNIEANESSKTFAKMYLITKQQLEDVAKQETDSEHYLTINFEEGVSRGYSIFKSPSWYGRLLYLGKDTGLPIFTLTNEISLSHVTRPSTSYLLTIANGIRQSHKLTTKELVEYFSNKKGIAGNYPLQELQTLIK